MWLEILERDHKLPARMFQRVAATVFGEEMDDVAKTAMHRPEFFGQPFLALVREALRAPSFWTVGEREYMAAVTSRVNACDFCALVHTETARITACGEVDVDTGAGRPELSAVLALLERVSRDDVAAEDIARVRAAGVPEDAIADALAVNLVFNIVNRLANAFGWSWDSDDHLQAGARGLRRFGYKLPGLVLR